MTMLSIDKVVNISVLTPPTGLAAYALNNLVCFTKETPTVPLTASYAVYSSSSEVETAWGSGSATYAAALKVFGQSPNILSGGGIFIVVPLLTGEVLEQAIVRAQDLVYFGGFAANYTLGVSGPTSYTGATGLNLEATRAAAVAQSNRKLFFVGATGATSLSAGGLAYVIDAASESYTRVLHHTLSAEIEGFKWAYASRGMSTNFSAVNTAATMNLKLLAGVLPDSGVSSTLYDSAKAVGADMYVNMAGQSCVCSFGANEFFDDVYNLQWLIGALEVAGFNYLRQTSTKIPQTETGMDGLKSAYRAVCRQAVSNGFIAPGTWTGADTFGTPEDFHRNIGDFGFYIYSLPVALQANADRIARLAPTVQIALKYSGAIHKTSVIVNVNK
ncbi:MAG: DUF3383 family protein [Lentisphaerota bacterium]